MKVKVYNLQREEVGDIELADEVWGAEIREHLLHEVVTAQRASRRAGTQRTRERSAVSGTNRKLYRQKGTGRARQGGARAGHRRGGGMAHALDPRDYRYRPPRKVRIGALCSALSLFAKEDRLLVVESFALAERKTRLVAKTLATLAAEGRSLVVDKADNQNLVVSIRNLKDHQFLPPEGVNVYDLLRHERLVVTRAAAMALEARCLDRTER